MSNKYRVMFLDDSSTDQKLIELLVRIKKLPIELTLMSNPLEALDYLESVQNDRFPQCIVIDINMPFMNGFEFADHYHQSWAEKHPATLLYIASSSIQLSDRDRADKHPAIRGYIDKPFSLEKLEKEILSKLRMSAS